MLIILVGYMHSITKETFVMIMTLLVLIALATSKMPQFSSVWMILSLCFFMNRKGLSGMMDVLRIIGRFVDMEIYFSILQE